MQDGIDLIDAVVRHPATGPRLARKLYGFFMNEADAPDAALLQDMSRIYYDSGFEIKPMLFRLMISAQFHDERNWYKRYSWPVEFVVALAQGSRLERLLAVQCADAAPEHGAAALRAARRRRMGSRPRLVLERRHAGADEFRGAAGVEPEIQPARSRAAGGEDARERCSRSCSTSSRRTTSRPRSYNALLDYARAGITWSGSDDQIATKAAGLVHLVVGSGDYQLV